MLASEPVRAANAVKDVAATLRRWTDAGRIVEEPITRLRHRLLWDDDFGRVVAKHQLELGQIEDLSVRYRQCCIHADLHGGNILVDGQGRPILIDFGEVGEGAAALDPISLDLSIFFHPASVGLGLRTAAEAALIHWGDVDAYIAAHPFPAFAKACRDWAHDVAGGDQAVRAGAYAYLVRQLKFETVDHALTTALITGLADSITSARS